MHEKDEFKSIKSLNIFYQVKTLNQRKETILPCRGHLYVFMRLGKFAKEQQFVQINFVWKKKAKQIYDPRNWQNLPVDSNHV